jgi:hypothetical protein
MTSAAGVDLNRAASGGADPLRVQGRFLISLDDADRNLSAQFANRALQQRSLARPRRAHQIEGHDFATFKPAAVVLGEVIVLGENILLELKRPRCRMLVGITVIVVMLMSFVRMIMMMGAMLMAVIAVRVTGVVFAGKYSQARFGVVGASTGGTHFKLPRLIGSSIPVH